MKTLFSLVICAALTSACATMGSGMPHADSPAAAAPIDGPALCRDGTVPPCNSRD